MLSICAVRPGEAPFYAINPDVPHAAANGNGKVAVAAK
jgi:hypothetical protein